MIEVRESAEASAWVARRLMRPSELLRQVPLTLISREGLGMSLGILLGLALWLAGWELLGIVPLVIGFGWTAWISRGLLISFGAYEDDQLVAGIRLRSRGRELVIMGLWVEPDFRGRKLSELLLRAVFEYAERKVPAGRISQYAPTHPASRHLARTYLAGGRLQVGGKEFQDSLGSLNARLV